MQSNNILNLDVSYTDHIYSWPFYSYDTQHPPPPLPPFIIISEPKAIQNYRQKEYFQDLLCCSTCSIISAQWECIHFWLQDTCYLRNSLEYDKGNYYLNKLFWAQNMKWPTVKWTSYLTFRMKCRHGYTIFTKISRLQFCFTMYKGLSPW